MLGKKIIVIVVSIILILGALGIFVITPVFNNSAPETDEDQIQDNTESSRESTTTERTIANSNSDWELLLSANNTFADGESGYGSDVLEFSANNIYQMSIKMHIVSELCVSCGGTGRGEVSLAIIMPSGEIAYRDTYTQTTDLNLIWTHPQGGTWNIAIEGVAIGEDYKVGYSALVLSMGVEE
jgi:hypothetical protein